MRGERLVHFDEDQRFDILFTTRDLVKFTSHLCQEVQLYLLLDLINHLTRRVYLLMVQIERIQFVFRPIPIDFLIF